MVTPNEMRLFALDCLHWAELTDSASHRDLMLNVAKTWMNTASAIERGTGADANGATGLDYPMPVLRRA